MISYLVTMDLRGTSATTTCYSGMCCIPKCSGDVFIACEECSNFLCFDHIDSDCATQHETTPIAKKRKDSTSINTVSQASNNSGSIACASKRTKHRTHSQRSVMDFFKRKESPSSSDSSLSKTAHSVNIESCLTDFQSPEFDELKIVKTKVGTDSSENVMQVQQVGQVRQETDLTEDSELQLSEDSAETQLGNTFSDAVLEAASPIPSHPFHPTDLSAIPKQHLASRTLTFQNGWFTEFPWLHHEPAVCMGIICYYCYKAERLNLLRLAGNKECTFITAGFQNWKRALELFRGHARCQSHKYAVNQVCQHDKAEPVHVLLSTQTQEGQVKARASLEVIFTSIKYLARQGLALRGHRDGEGNFHQLLQLRALDNQNLKQWMMRSIDYTSYLAQNEILQLLAHDVVRSIAADVIAAKQFSVIVDGTQDSSRKEQLSICLRYVDEQFNPHEKFIGLYEPPKTTGNIIATCIKDVLVRLNISIDNLRGQSYDGASNMAGKFSGCQAVVKQSQPLAVFVHCGAHCVNLVTLAACESSPFIRDALSVVNEVGSLFSQSLNARSKFNDITSHDTPFTNAHYIRPMCPTRWVARVRSVQSMVSQLGEVLQCLAQLSEESTSVSVRASGLYSQVCKASLLMLMKISLVVLIPLERLNRALQSTYQTIAGMLEAVREVINDLQCVRNDDEFTSLLQYVTDQETKLSLEAITIPRQKRPPARYDGGGEASQYLSVSDYYRPIYFAVIDEAVSQLRNRFADNHDLHRYCSMEKVLTTGQLTADDEEVLASYPEIGVVGVQELASQLRSFRRTRPVQSLRAAVTALQAMVPEVRAEYPEVCQLVRLLLVVPASSAEAERSFSALRRLKTWLRTTMNEVRLNSAAICHVHRSMLDNVKLIPLLREFVERSDIRKRLFGKFSDV